jgi:serine/threonine protein kinase
VTETNEIHPLRQSDPESLGTYRITGRIGRGGMGIVYLAETAQGDRAAVKVISPELADDEGFRDRFRREVESARRVRRFCTAPVLDAQVDGEPLFIVTEYVDGPNLDEFVRTRGPMRGSNLDHLAVGVATALTAIHGAGVIHRDLKPANVLLSSVGPRVIDFGIARALDTVADVTRTGHFVGTPAYMAPELIAGETASAASDVFSWACVVTFAGTGRVPFVASSVPAVLYQISHGEPNLDGLDDSMVDLVRRALDKDPRRRPSAQELLDRLVGQTDAETARAAATVDDAWTQVVPNAPTRVATAHGRVRRGSRRSWLLGAVAVAAAAGIGITAALMFDGDGPPSKTTSVFSDDFSNSNTGWSGGNYQNGLGDGYLNGQYRIFTDASTVSQMEDAPYTQTPPNRLLMSVDVRNAVGTGYGQVGLYCRGAAGSDELGYEFLIRLDGKGVVIRKAMGSNGAKQLAQSSDTKGFRAGDHRNHLQAVCDARNGAVTLKLWVNGALAVSATDTDKPLANQKAGLIVAQRGGGNGDAQADFDNFDLSGID